MRNPDRMILVLWFVAIALITRDELREPSGPIALPAPWRYTGSAIVYGIAGIISEAAASLGAALAAGWTLWLAYTVLGSSEAAAPAKAVAGTFAPLATTTQSTARQRAI